MNHLHNTGTTRTYDPVKQYYNLAPYHDPTRPVFVPRESRNLNGDFLLTTHIPTNVANFFPKVTKLVETPLDDQSHSPYASLVLEHYFIAQLIFVNAKLSSFVLKKQYEYFPITTNITEEIN